jgi:hypothetical protein
MSRNTRSGPYFRIKGIYSIGNLRVNMKDSLNYLEAAVFGEKQFLRWY